MRKKRSNRLDPVEQQIELALRPGELIHDRACFSFVDGLEAVIAEIDKVGADEPQRAVALFETFLAGCHAKADQLDDSSGYFGQFAHNLICRWIKARQASGAGADATVSTLLEWMDDDPYAFCYGIEKDVVAALDRVGLAAFEKRVRECFRAAAAAEPGGYPRKHWGAMLRDLRWSGRRGGLSCARARDGDHVRGLPGARPDIRRTAKAG